MRIALKARNPFSFLFVSSRGDEYLARYVLRECGRGRSLADVLADSYIRNRSTQTQRERLLERPEVVAALGDQTIAALELDRYRGEPTTAA